ncbi:uncharacterized protein LOC141592252 [Silene latifolia]|uniref:uncharacterized protein LOC141592252 n=1 Tax=Silene latifolia TaxID=37657 RepID=UPI003D76CF65
MIDEKYLDIVLVPSGLLVLGAYHVWLFIVIVHHPTRTVVGLNAISRHQWVCHMMSDPGKNSVLAVQTLRNNLMASTLLATIAITLSSLISAVVSGASQTTALIYTVHTVKYFSILVCFLVAFFCSMQCVRYYAHVSFLINVPSPQGRAEYIQFVARQLNRGSLFWSLGLRAFYFAFPLLIWIFGPVAMFACSCLMTFLLYFLDFSSTSVSKNLSNGYVHKYNSNADVESRADSRNISIARDSNLHSSLLGDATLCSGSSDVLS